MIKTLTFIPQLLIIGSQVAKLCSEEGHKLVGEWEKMVVLFIACVQPLTFHVQHYVREQWPQLMRQ